jgi:integrase
MPERGRAPTVGEFLAGWIERDRARVRPGTWQVREQHVRLWLTPALGKIALPRLTPADVERVMADFLKSGRPPSDAARTRRAARRVVAPLTVRSIRATLRIALGEARRDGLVGRNAAAEARPPRAPTKSIAYLKAPEVRRLLDATRDHEFGPVYAVAVSTGLRLGENLGLEWPDVDFVSGTISVRRSLARTLDGGYALGETKTTRSRRTLPMTATARDALRRQRARQDAARLAAGTAWQDRDGLVFTDALGRPCNPLRVGHAFARTRVPGVPRVRFHDLRHSAATLMLAEGVPLPVISDWLGHSSIGMTSDFYAAIVPELRRDAADAIDRALR